MPHQKFPSTQSDKAIVGRREGGSEGKEEEEEAGDREREREYMIPLDTVPKTLFSQPMRRMLTLNLLKGCLH